MGRMKTLPVVLLSLLAVPPVSGGLSPEQKAADLQQIAALYAKNYGPYEWKRDAFGVDLFDLRSWIARAMETRSDLEFLDLVIEYVASLDDAHCSVTFPFFFSASAPLHVDLYDGKVLIDRITRSSLPESRYPFQAGDELISVDGVSMQDWIQRLRKYSISANERSTARIALARMFSRSQSTNPFAHEIGDAALLVVRRAATGAEETYSVPWSKTGFPITDVGPVPDLILRAQKARVHNEASPDPGSLPAYALPLLPLMNASLKTDEAHAVLGLGQLPPLFALPAGFQIRAGLAGSDPFFSGVYSNSGVTIGYIRLPSMNPAVGASAAVQRFEQEVLFMQGNTDGLVIDVMRNPGGQVNYVDELLRRLHPNRFRTMGFEIRATLYWLQQFANSVIIAELSGAPTWQVAALRARYEDILGNYLGNRGRSGPVPLTSHTLDLLPPVDRDGRTVAYTKPILVLTDEFSASGGDMFPAVLQDNRRATIMGWRTMGAGGTVVPYDGTNFTESFVRVTTSLMNRNRDIVSAEYPAAPYIENIGVRPDIPYDFMTRDNLLQNGRPFVEAFTAEIVRLVRR